MKKITVLLLAAILFGCSEPHKHYKSVVEVDNRFDKIIELIQRNSYSIDSNNISALKSQWLQAKAIGKTAFDGPDGIKSCNDPECVKLFRVALKRQRDYRNTVLAAQLDDSIKLNQVFTK